MAVTIYHNPKCSNSRSALEIINASGQVPRVIDYQKTPLSRDELKALIAKMGVPVKSVVREKEQLFADLHLDGVNDDALLDTLAKHPILLNRPIVATDKGAKLCRPPEIVKTLL